MSGDALRELFSQPDISIMPGAGSPLEVLMIEQAGYKAASISGYSVAAQRFGLPDLGLTAFEEMRSFIQACRDVSDIPLMVDCDTGYGGVLNVRRMVQAFETVGVAAVEIEDQTWPKRCGLMDKITVEPVETALLKIDAALSARRGSDMMIIARTDARKPLGFDEAMRRCKLFKAAGADCVYMHSPETIDELRIFASQISGPKMLSMAEGECTDSHSLKELGAMGYGIAGYPTSLLRASMKAMQITLQKLSGPHDVHALTAEMVSHETIGKILGTEEFQGFEERLVRSPGFT